MKNTNRIRQNGSAKAAAQQGKTPADKLSATNPWPLDEHDLAAIRTATKFILPVMVEHDGGAIDDIGGIELSPNEFNAIRQDAAARGEKWGVWLWRTLLETPALQALKGKNTKAQLPATASNEINLEMVTTEILDKMLEHLNGLFKKSRGADREYIRAQIGLVVDEGNLRAMYVASKRAPELCAMEGGAR